MPALKTRHDDSHSSKIVGPCICVVMNSLCMYTMALNSCRAGGALRGDRRSRSRLPPVASESLKRKMNDVFDQTRDGSFEVLPKATLQ